MNKPYKIEKVKLYSRNDAFAYPMISIDSREYNNHIFLLTCMIHFSEGAYRESSEVARIANSFNLEATLRYKPMADCYLQIWPITNPKILLSHPKDIFSGETPWQIRVEAQSDTDEYIAQDGSMIARTDIDFEEF